MSTLVHLTVGICLLSAVALFAPRAEATASAAPGRIQAAVGKSHAVEPAALACTHRRVCRQGAGCAWRKVCKRS